MLLIVSPYILYPVAVVLVARLRRPRPEPAEGTPSVTLLISAFNEAQVIRSKIENSLALDYPPEQLDFLVISDASDDGTDEIVESFGNPRIKLCRQESRGGKTKGITRFMPEADGEIVVFSDANSIYDRQALRHLTRHFSDPDVGYVVGYQRYVSQPGLPVSDSEDTYWRYEKVIKESESRLSSVVGGDGAIYAIRRSLFVPLQDDETNDFVTALQIVAAGYRGVYEKRAICDEHTAADFRGEFRRKVRIVNRGFRGVLRVPQALNPFRVGLFAWQLFVHKVLRWFVPLFLLSLLASSVFLAVNDTPSSLRMAALLRTNRILRSCPHALCAGDRETQSHVYLAYYFCLANVAAILGVLGVFFGKKIVVWQSQAGRRAETGTTRNCRTKSGRFGPFGSLKRLLGVVGGTPLSMSTWKCRAWNGCSGSQWRRAGLYIRAAIGLSCGFCRAGEVRLVAGDRERLPAPISLIIPAYNEEKCLAAKLRNAVDEIDYPRELLEIIVASDGSSDTTLEIAGSFEDRGIRVLVFPIRRGKASVLNDAVVAAAHDVLCLCDANVMFEPQALRRLVDRLSDPEVGAVTGEVHLESDDSNFGEGESLYCRLERDVQLNESRVATTICVDGGMYVLRRELYQTLPADTILDDFVTSINVIRQRKRVVYEGLAKARESGTPLGRQEFRRRARVAAGAFQALRRGNFPPVWRIVPFCQFVSHKLLRWTGPLWLTLWLVSAAALWNEGVIYRLAFAAQVMFYLFALAATISVPFRRSRVGGVAFYFTMSHVAMVVGTIKGVFNLQRAAWSRTERPDSKLPLSTTTEAT